MTWLDRFIAAFATCWDWAAEPLGFIAGGVSMLMTIALLAALVLWAIAVWEDWKS